MHDIEIYTKRLLLRPLKLADAENVFEWVSDERVSRYMVYTTYTNIEQDCWGMGYATEAVKAMMHYAYINFGARKFASSHCEPNLALVNVMKKCGLHFVGYGTFEKLDGNIQMRSMKYEGEL